MQTPKSFEVLRRSVDKETHGGRTETGPRRKKSFERLLLMGTRIEGNIHKAFA